MNLSSMSFDRVLNTYVWTGEFKKEIDGPIWALTLQQRLRSRLIKTDETAIQDEYQGIINLRARLADNVNYEIKNSSNVLADNRSIDLGRMAQHQFMTGVEFLPAGTMRGEALGGYELNTQEEENDRGFTYALGFDARQIKLEEFNASLQSSWNQSLLGRGAPRTGDIGLVSVVISAAG